MTSEDVRISKGCAKNPDDRTRALVTVEPGLEALLSLVHEVRRLGHTPPEGPAASYLASHGNGGEDNG